MLKGPLNLAKSRVLLANDDGIDAPGLKLLEKILRPLVKDLWIAAPRDEQSGTGHSLTLRRPLRIIRKGRQKFAIDGTPTDAMMLAINHILRDSPPDLVLSGINRGGNLGEDVTYSGTIAAAMEGTLLGVPSIALSLVINGKKAHWPTAEKYLPLVLDKITRTDWPDNVLMNVNFPDVTADRVKGVMATQQGRRKLGDELMVGHDPRGEPYYWIGSMRTEEPTMKGSDLAAVEAGMISVTPIHLDLTHRSFLKTLRTVLN
ncbi:MAG: 5'/3'-nucleotidase SurE [Alphaproteobacteria bacterium]|jgi:5'-nucleotidase